MTKCDECRWPYPEYLLSGFSTSQRGDDGKMVCGICALVLTNKVHGTDSTTFTGEMAELIRLEAVSWRSANSALRPDGAP